MFSDELKKISWEETTKAIYSKTGTDVRRILGKKEHLDVNDFMTLISPATTPYLEVTAHLSQRCTMERFSKTISMLIPLYLADSCTNSCVYCGSRISNPMKRTILTEEEIVNEYRATKRLAPFKNLLLVIGENPAAADVPYIAQALGLAKPHFSNLQIEVMPLKAGEYQELTNHGPNGAICFQGVYHKANYKTYHPRGMRPKSEWHVDGFNHMGQTGIHRIGVGALIGLEEWRTDITMMTYHLRYLQRHYWKTKYSVNFPRIRPSENGGFQPNVVMSGREPAQLIFTMRIFDRDVDISCSTHESAEIRNHMVTLSITTMSTESKTEPGEYYSYPQILEQFHVNDERKAVEVERDLKKLGHEPVWKDRDQSFGFKR